MIVQLLMVLIIIIVLFNSLVYSIQNRCPTPYIKIPFGRASRMPFYAASNAVVDDKSNPLYQNIGIDKINIKLDRDVPCGIYKVDTSYGKAVLYTTKRSMRFGYLNFVDAASMDAQTKKEFDKSDLFDLWNLERYVDRFGDEFVNTYNRGCC